VSALLDWLRDTVSDWKPSAVGVFRKEAAHDWPISASTSEDLREKLTHTGHLMPLPSEPAALANVMETELRSYLVNAANKNAEFTMREGTQRSYPDLEFTYPDRIDSASAVDIKCARRKTATRLNNAITLYTGNTWFLWPQLKFGGILRPFSEYQEHLALLVLYDYDSTLPERIKNVTVVIHETWKIASKSRSSSTREYRSTWQRWI
jgi:hypothetical protein